MLPWVNCWATSETETPLPMAVALTPLWVEANRSPNSARDPLNPAVETLARLFAVTDRSWFAALSPVRAILNDIEISWEHGFGCGAPRRKRAALLTYHMTETIELSATVPFSVSTSTAFVVGSTRTLSTL